MSKLYDTSASNCFDKLASLSVTVASPSQLSFLERSEISLIPISKPLSLVHFSIYQLIGFASADSKGPAISFNRSSPASSAYTSISWFLESSTVSMMVYTSSLPSLEHKS